MTRVGVLVAIVAALATATAADPRRGGTISRLEHVDANPTLGPRDALVTMELYFVPGSDEGHAAYQAVIALAARHPRRLRVVFRPRQVGPRQSVAALALAAHRGGRFFALMDALSATVPAPSPAASLERAVALGLPRDRMIRADRDPMILRTLAHNEHRGFRAPTTELPELVVNGEPTSSSSSVRVNAGSTTAAILDGLYQVALADARLGAAQGIAPGAMPRWGHWNLWCTAPEAPPPPPRRDDDDDPPPRFASSLQRLIDRGTRCAAPEFRPAKLDEVDLFDRHLEAPKLVAGPLPLAGAPALGPADAAIPVIVACNLAGPSCRAQLGLLRPLVEIYEGQVRLLWVPLGELEDEGRRPELRLALAAMCAASLGDGWPFASDPSGFQDALPTAVDLARVANADPAAVTACADGELGPVVTAIAAVEAAGVEWGPTVIVGGRTYTGGFVDARAAAAIIEAELAPGLFEQLAPGYSGN